MTEFGVKIQQQSRTPAADGDVRTMAGDREGAAFTGDINSKYMQWLLAGQVFETHNLAVATAITLEANAAYDPLEPFFRATVPAGITMIPIMFKVMPTDAWTAFDQMTITAHDTDTDAAGGLAGAPVQPLFIDNQGAGNPESSVLSAVLNGDTAMTEAAATNLRLIYRAQLIGTGDFMPSFNALTGDPTCAISGPAAFLVTFLAGGAEEVWYHFIWAEVDKNYLVNR